MPNSEYEIKHCNLYANTEAVTAGHQPCARMYVCVRMWYRQASGEYSSSLQLTGRHVHPLPVVSQWRVITWLSASSRLHAFAPGVTRLITGDARTKQNRTRLVVLSSHQTSIGSNVELSSVCGLVQYKPKIIRIRPVAAAGKSAANLRPKSPLYFFC